MLTSNTRVKNNSGFSLIELMIAVLLGVSLTAAVISVYVSTIHSSSTSISLVKLDQDLNTILKLIEREVRRAGFDSNSLSAEQSEFGILEVSSNCLRYNYDAGFSKEPKPATNQYFGFKLNRKNVLFGTRATQAGCTNGSWNTINDSDAIQITALKFSNPGTICINLKDNSNCNSHTDNYVPPAVGDKLLKKYLINISVTANLITGNQSSRTMSSVVRLHNNLIETNI